MAVIAWLVITDDLLVSPLGFSLTLALTKNGWPILAPQLILWLLSFTFGYYSLRIYFRFANQPRETWGRFTEYVMNFVDNLMPVSPKVKQKSETVLRNALNFTGFVVSTLVVGGILTTVAVSKRRGPDWNWAPWAIFGSGLYALEFALLQTWAATGAFNLWEVITRLF